jgi:acetyl esterase/lipase
MHSSIFTFTIILSVLLGCKKSDQPVRLSNLSDSTSLDVAYGSNPYQKMDIYLPAGRTSTNTPFMVLVHGGGWAMGDKGEFNAIITRLQTMLPTYAFFNINYRLFDGSNNKYPAQEEDLKLAVNFILGKSGDFGISNKMVLTGASAGAHLALLQAYKYLNPIKAKAVISFFGPTDLVEFYNNPPSPALQPSLNALFGWSPEQNLQAYQQASPAFFVNGQSTPTLLLHGNLDLLVPVSQSILLKNKLEALGVANKLVVYPYEGHGWMGASLEDSYTQVEAFLAIHVK